MGKLFLVLLFAILGGLLGGLFFGRGGAVLGAIASGSIAGVLLIAYSITDVALSALQFGWQSD